jgi:fructose-1,6-bisphosphatase/inositol monophosphatase family enzyme
VFIDPIDGTREFSTSKCTRVISFCNINGIVDVHIDLGEQCSICIGFSDAEGKAVAGIVYRPIPEPPTWAAGAPAENWHAHELDTSGPINPRGFLTSNGGISKFIEKLALLSLCELQCMKNL